MNNRNTADSGATTQVVVPLSKSKRGLLLLGSIAFVVGSLWIWSLADSQNRFSPIYLKVVAVAGLAFFGLCGVHGCFKLFDMRPGLIIDSGGIVDNSSAVAAGRILWEEITGFSVSEIAGQRFLTVAVSNPQKFVRRGWFIVRLLNALNTKMTGSPINISSNSLKMQFDELVELMTEALKKHNSSA